MSPAPLTPAEENRQRALIVAAQKAAEKAASDAEWDRKLVQWERKLEDSIPAKAVKFYQLCLGLIDQAVREGKIEVEINATKHSGIFNDSSLQIYNSNDVNSPHIPERCWELVEPRLLGLGYRTSTRSEKPSVWSGRYEDVLPDFIVTISW
jgi:hypothetical protein